MEEIFECPIGGSIKLNLNVKPIDGLALARYEWQIKLYTSPNKVLIMQKKECVKVDEDNYKVAFNSADVGIGNLRYVLMARVPDGDFPDGIRIEPVKGELPVKIIPEL